MFAELFAHLDCALAYDGNPWDELVVIIREDTYGPDETPVSIGMYGWWYTIEFRPSKLKCVFCGGESGPVLTVMPYHKCQLLGMVEGKHVVGGGV